MRIFPGGATAMSRLEYSHNKMNDSAKWVEAVSKPLLTNLDDEYF
jgi:hypothetical protein